MTTTTHECTVYYGIRTSRTSGTVRVRVIPVPAKPCPECSDTTGARRGSGGEG